MSSSEIDHSDPDGNALGEAHDAVDALRLEALGEAEDIRATRSFWRELPVLVVIAIALAVVLKMAVVQAFYIPSSSMEDTLQINDRVVVSKLSYRIGGIERGDVIVFDDPRLEGGSADESIVGAVLRNVAESLGISTPESEFIKRVVALPGEVVEIRAGVVFVDGTRLHEPYVLVDLRAADFGPETVPLGHVFVMGDNRGSSRDSRVFGPVPIDDIVGRAFSIIWPPGNWGGL